VPKLSKISLAFNILVRIPVQEMVYLGYPKITPMDVSLSGTTDQKRI